MQIFFGLLIILSILNIYTARKVLGTSLSLQCSAALVDSGFSVRSRKKRQQETKVNCSFFSFLIYSLPTQPDCVRPVDSSRKD